MARNPHTIDAEIRRRNADGGFGGGLGTIRFNGVDDIEQSLAIPVDADMVAYKLATNPSTLVPEWAEDIPSSPSANLRAVGFGGQIGNKVDPIQAAGYGVVVYAPWDGTINEIILRASGAVNAVVDIQKNGVSIFSGTAVKPTLAASQTDTKTVMTDIDTAVVRGQRFELILNSVSLDPTFLSLVMFVEKS